jgi:cysteine synthase
LPAAQTQTHPRSAVLVWPVASGAAAVAAIEVAQELDQGMVVTIFPDAGYKYLSDKEIWEMDSTNLKQKVTK